ncbi:MAG: FAD-dependent oxidoreductase [Ruminococcaceae bacterium]|nr:FAD-dependent oxidoreductase [Oscillospiraceae bacterium]
MHDIVIIGAGPAGLTAALYALRANKTVLLIEKASFGGQITYSPKIENYPGFEGISGNELADRFFEQAVSQGAEFELEEAVKIVDNGNEKTVITDSGAHKAKAVIIATGAKHRMLGVPHEEEYAGNGISFCAVCDGAFYEGKEVIVVGGGNSALQEAILLCDSCSKVTVIQNLSDFTGEKKLVEILKSRGNAEFVFDTVIKEFKGDGDELKGAVTVNEKTGEEREISFDGAFIAIGLAPDNKAFENIAGLDGYGYVASGEDCLTKTPGVYTAGDCRTKKIRQITTAAADGAVAALAACRYIDEL